MYRLRLLLVLAFVVVLGASLARGQDATNPFDKPDKRDHKSTQDKAKSNDSHRKHWWSPPHWLHKKHDGKTANASTRNQTVKASDNNMVAAANTPKTSSSNKTVTGARPTAKTVATGAPGSTQSKKTTATAAGKKRHDCSPEQAKKGGCTVDKGSTQKGTARPS